MAKWMIENGSDVHQGRDGPLMRAALVGHRIPMMELLVSHGADVNAEWNGYFPIIFAPCETVDSAALEWLLDHGANPNCANPDRRYPGTALDFVIATYSRSGQLGTCILTLRGATLLHVAAEYGNLGAATLLLDRGADLNARAMVDESGIGGQTAIFHAVTQYSDWGLPMAQLLLERGADLAVRVKLPGHYERPGEVVECTPLGYALRFPGHEGKTVALLRERGAAG
ncbi:MAG TPA: ankyrin repeat domain-containing protein [Thermoanaerobaculia bacterium]|nr:ankyrin repeat domain-containing protein [Thermoanaerobaculia bacterium]